MCSSEDARLAVISLIHLCSSGGGGGRWTAVVNVRAPMIRSAGWLRVATDIPRYDHVIDRGLYDNEHEGRCQSYRRASVEVVSSECKIECRCYYARPPWLSNLFSPRLRCHTAIRLLCLGFADPSAVILLDFMHTGSREMAS